jgi:hypothetical protein
MFVEQAKKTQCWNLKTFTKLHGIYRGRLIVSLKIAASLAAVMLVAGCSKPIDLPQPNTNAKLPGEYINLEGWTLTTPLIGKNGNVMEVEQPALSKYSSDLFKLNDNKNGVVFRTPASGAVQAGATAPRTEMRQADPDGSGKTWSALKGRHIMAATVSVDEVPSTSQMEIVGQIHDTGPYIMAIQYSKGHLFVKTDDTLVTLADPYKLGTPFAYKFIVEDGKIEVYYNDKLKQTYRNDCPRCYFKIGSYLQAPPEPGSKEFGQTTVYSLNVTHEQKR